MLSFILLIICSSSSIAGNCRVDAIKQQLFEQNSGRILIVAHRGAHESAPENSLEAIREAIALGAAVVEIDLRRTADNYMVLMHDETLDRTTQESGKVSEFTLAAISKLQLLNVAGQLTEETVPTLEAALAEAKGKILVMLDSKVDTQKDIAALATIVKKAQVENQIVLYDYNPATLQKYRKAMPNALVMARTKQPENIDGLVKKLQPAIFHIEPSYNSLAINKKFDQLRIPTWINFLGDLDNSVKTDERSLFQPQLEAQPDLVQSDYPEKLIAYLDEHNLHPKVLSKRNFEKCKQ